MPTLTSATVWLLGMGSPRKAGLTATPLDANSFAGSAERYRNRVVMYVYLRLARRLGTPALAGVGPGHGARRAGGWEPSPERSVLRRRARRTPAAQPGLVVRQGRCPGDGDARRFLGVGRGATAPPAPSQRGGVRERQTFCLGRWLPSGDRVDSFAHTALRLLNGRPKSRHVSLPVLYALLAQRSSPHSGAFCLKISKLVKILSNQGQFCPHTPVYSDYQPGKCLSA